MMLCDGVAVVVVKLARWSIQQSSEALLAVCVSANSPDRAPVTPCAATESSAPSTPYLPSVVRDLEQP